MQSTDTIVALSTPPGRSGIGVIRLSGARSLEIARTLVSDNQFTPEPNHARLQTVYDLESRDALDRALITYFKAPHSFTGEDVVEFSCHGSPVLLRRLVDLILMLDARLAGPGEFTLRALSNGRINLSQAEAVRDLINAQTESAIKQAARQLRGELSSYLQPIKDALLDIIVPLESSLEFVEDDLPDVAISRINANLSDLIEKLDRLAATYRSGHLLKDGLKVTLAGRPNVGKSSVFNSLLSSERAIVTDVPGTTRDSLSEVTSIEGVPILLIDTAGMRATEDKVENLGVERTRRAIADADLILVILDGSQPLTDEDKEVLAEVRELPHLVALNKADLESFSLNGSFNDTAVIPVSAKTGAGLDALRAAILKPFADGGFEYSGLLITDARHHDLLRRTQNALQTSAHLLEHHASEELVLAGLYDALRFLGQITGETTTEDVLSQIFATFCIGK
ncbi:MAG TPA: tRNA uridine-5-carboxymethylaminomethyl(34) synthesis GTPase MnmE [Pyrinomonadaceae bacterium]|nr:tRNA uridine-5-carboxymethylaminomethyl(34) synthesis GTPase MnmE [Pyrinomonadaceae bacterium]